MHFRKILISSAIALSLFTSGSSYAAELKTGKVGVIVQLSGLAAQFGIGVQNAITVAQDDLKQKGVIDLTVHYEDHQQQAQLGLLGFEKLVDSYDVPVVIANASPIILAVGPAAAERERVLYNFAAVSPKIKTLGEWVVTGTPLSDNDSVQLADLIYNKKGLKTVGLLNVNDANGITFADAFTKAFEALGGKVLAHETNEQTVVDLRTQLLKINATNPDALVIFSNVPENGYAVAQAREMGQTRPIFANTFIADPENFKVAGKSLDGVMGVTMRFDPDRSPAAKAFSEKFKAKANRDPSVSEALAYDAAMLAGEAIAKVGEDPKAIRDYMVSVKDWDGVSTTFNFDEHGILKVSLSPFVIAGGKLTFPATN